MYALLVQYTALSPAGVYESGIYDISKFCTKHDLSRQGAYNVAQRGQADHKGWIFTMEIMALNGDNRVDHQREMLENNSNKKISFKIGNRVRIES